MKLRFSFEALSHLDAIHFFIEPRSRPAATHILNRIFTDCDRLAEFPQLGHAGVVPGTQEWTVSGLPYIIVYEISENKSELIVLGIFHGSQAR
jgi:toxin ParE1/3/4